MYLTRTLETFFVQAASHFPVMMLTGARQVGKTTLLKHLCEEERRYVTLDDPIVLTLAKSDPSLFLQRFPPPVLIDEIQYAPELLPYIKMEVDQRQKSNLFWLTGSQQFQMMKGVTESLTGRVGIVKLSGLSHGEQRGAGAEVSPFLPIFQEIQTRAKKSKPLAMKELYRIIWRGAFPAIALHDEMERDLFFSSYVQTYLQRDISDLAQVGDKTTFLRFLRAAAARTAQILNISELARDADIAPNTAKKWLGILMASGMVYLLEPYYTNVTKRLVKSPKLYFLDTGLGAWLTGWSSPETLEAGAASGTILETWLMGEILKTWQHNGLQESFFYYRDKDKKEIDLLIFKDDKIYPVEFKKTASPVQQDVRHFQSLQRLKIRMDEGGIVCLVNNFIPLAKNIWAIPVGLI